MSINKLLKFAYGAAIVGFVGYMFLSSPSTTRWLQLNSILDCDLDAELLVDSDNWQITASSIPSQIIWQKAEPVTRRSLRVGPSITGHIASNGQVIYRQFWGGESCDKLPILAAFDSASGQELWRYRPEEIIYYKLFTVRDGYVLLGVDGIAKIDFQGQVLWQQTAVREIPFRDFRMMYEIDDLLFFPGRRGQTYKFSSEWGDLVGTENQGDVIALFDQFALIKSSDTSVSLINLDQGHDVLYTLHFPNVPLNPSYLFATKHQDKLFLAFDSTGFEVHDFETGRLLWKVYKPISGAPTIIKNMLVAFTLDNGLEVYDIQTGEVLGNVLLTSRDSNPTDENSSLDSIWITADQETIFMRQIYSLELIAVKLDLDHLDNDQSLNP